jgi:hypothetical protein
MPKSLALHHEFLVYPELRRILAKLYDLLLEFRYFMGFGIDLTFELGDRKILGADMGLERLYFAMLIADLCLQFHHSLSQGADIIFFIHPIEDILDVARAESYWELEVQVLGDQDWGKRFLV